MKHHILIKIYILYISVFLSLNADILAQKVPSKMSFANQHLYINKAARKELQKEVDYLLSKPDYLMIKLKRAKLYFPFIESVFKETNFPDDFKYLAIQESGLVPDAVSKSNAIGFWQFKVPAAKEVGMIVNNKIDHRKNIIYSTMGAAKYITKNNEHFFNNWLLSLHAFQMGPGAVRRSKFGKAMGKKSIRITPKTYWYVKKYLVHKIAFEYALSHYKVKVVPYAKYYINGEKSFKELSRVLNTDIKTLKALNMWIKTDRFSLDNEIILYPSDKKILGGKIYAKSRDNNFFKLPEVDFFSLFNKTPILNVELYTAGKFHPEIVKTDGQTLVNNIKGTKAKSSDTINTLSIRGEAPISKILEYNNIPLTHDVIEGQVYYFKKKKNKAHQIKHYVVKENETLWSISQKFGIKLENLCQKNRISPDAKLKKGRILWMRQKRGSKTEIQYYSHDIKNVEGNEKKILGIIKKGKKEEKQDNYKTDSKEKKDSKAEITNKKTAKTLKYRVKKGDTLYRISKSYNVTVDELLKVNNINANELKLGMEIIIPQ